MTLSAVFVVYLGLIKVLFLSFEKADFFGGFLWSRKICIWLPSSKICVVCIINKVEVKKKKFRM